MLHEANVLIEGDMGLFELAAKMMTVSPLPSPEPEINPFLKQVTIQTKTRKVNAVMEELFDADGVSVDNQAREISHIKYVDRERFVKVMNCAFKAAFGLSSKGQRLFWLLVSEMGVNHGKDFLFLNYRKEFIINGEAMTIPKTSFYDGLKALQSAGFIAPKREKGYYWLNPNMLWNGDRVKLSTSYILKHGENHPEMPKVKRPGLDTVRGRKKKGIA